MRRKSGLFDSHHKFLQANIEEEMPITEQEIIKAHRASLDRICKNTKSGLPPGKREGITEGKQKWEGHTKFPDEKAFQLLATNTYER